MRLCFLLATVLAAGLLAGCSGDGPGDLLATGAPLVSATPDGDLPTGDLAAVVSVTDGDTIRVELDGVVFPVRYIGIDTPETSHPTVDVQCFGREATEANRALVEDEVVLLVSDVSDTDQYDRLLRYVYVDGAMVNEALVRQGFAVARAYPPDVRHDELLAAAEDEARSADRGLWGACRVTRDREVALTHASVSGPWPLGGVLRAGTPWRARV
ncbi:MAG: hypothetical protein GEU28_06485 [Dehalococcoidia bacterium]|nr:hypothetical protein [Dehalococcoidia bacterium]